MDDSPDDEPSTEVTPSQQPPLKVVLVELIRTQVCPPHLRLLVDEISMVAIPPTANGRRLEAYRLWLSDSHKAIQAVLQRDIHPFVTCGSIVAGSYVRLSRYRLAKGARLDGRGFVWYLQIDDLRASGTDGRLPKAVVPESNILNRRSDVAAKSHGPEEPSKGREPILELLHTRRPSVHREANAAA